MASPLSAERWAAAGRLRTGRSLPGRARADLRANIGFLLPSGLGILAFTLIPIAASLPISFFDWPLTSAPRFAGLANYGRLFGRAPVFVQALANTLLFVVAYAPANVVVSLGLAAWLTGPVRGPNPVLPGRPISAQSGILHSALRAALHLPMVNWLGCDH